MAVKTELDIIENPRTFLNRPYEGVEIGILPVDLTIPFLESLPRLKNETGLVLYSPIWFLIKAGNAIPASAMPSSSDALIHSHPIVDDQDHGELPSPNDFFNSSPTAPNFIVSLHGITKFARPNDSQMRYVKGAMDAFTPWFSGDDKWEKYEQFIYDQDFSMTFFPWDLLDEEKLSSLLYNGNA